MPSADTVILQNCSINKKLSDSFVAVNFLTVAVTRYHGVHRSCVLLEKGAKLAETDMKVDLLKLHRLQV